MSVVKARYFPAQVRLPGGQVLRRTYVVLAEGGDHAGLHIYSQPDKRIHHADIDWAGTPPLPATQRDAGRGVEVRLVTGEVAVITASQGCRCGALGRWAGPEFARTVAAR